MFGAIRSHDAALVRSLLQEDKSNERSAWLQYACECGADVEIVELLLNAGADVNATSPHQGNTPLHFAVCSFTPLDAEASVVRLLIRYGASVDIRNNFGRTPFDCARGTAQEELSKWSNDDEVFALGWGCIDVVNLLIKHGAPINKRNLYGSAPLHYVADRGSGEIVRALIRAGADVNLKNNGDQTPIRRSINNTGSARKELSRWVNDEEAFECGSTYAKIVRRALVFENLLQKLIECV